MQKTKARILIIDDDADVLTSARLVLKQHFKHVLAEDHPRNVESILNQEEVDVVLLDMNFTRGDNDGREGIYWLQQIKEVSPHTQIILMTAYGDVELAVRAIKLGATDFVLKPWKNEKLISTIHTALALGQSQQKIEKLEQVNQVYQENIQKPLDHFHWRIGCHAKGV